MIESIKEIINMILHNSNKPMLEELKPEINLRDDLGLDSLDLAELTVRIEDKFSIDIFQDGIVNTVADIMRKLENNDK